MKGKNAGEHQIDGKLTTGAGKLTSLKTRIKDLELYVSSGLIRWKKKTILEFWQLVNWLLSSKLLTSTYILFKVRASCSQVRFKLKNYDNWCNSSLPLSLQKIFKGSKNLVFLFRGRPFAMKFANCFIPSYCSSTDQSCKTSETILSAMDFEAWRRKLDMRGERCCNLYNNVTIGIWVTVLWASSLHYSAQATAYSGISSQTKVRMPHLKRCIGKWQIYRRNLYRLSFVCMSTEEDGLR